MLPVIVFSSKLSVIVLHSGYLSVLLFFYSGDLSLFIAANFRSLIIIKATFDCSFSQVICYSSFIQSACHWSFIQANRYLFVTVHHLVCLSLFFYPGSLSLIFHSDYVSLFFIKPKGYVQILHSCNLSRSFKKAFIQATCHYSFIQVFCCWLFILSCCHCFSIQPGCHCSYIQSFSLCSFT